jgi:hypothetical protein
LGCAAVDTGVEPVGAAGLTIVDGAGWADAPFAGAAGVAVWAMAGAAASAVAIAIAVGKEVRNISGTP